MIMYGELESTGKEATVTYFKKLASHSPGGIGQTPKYYVKTVIRLRLELSALCELPLELNCLVGSSRVSRN